jgi:nicotinamide-nucleotide amidase
MSDPELLALAERVGRCLKEHGLLLISAESCTGGWVAQVVTAVPGSSDWFDRGFVTYSNAAKQQVLGVAADTLDRFGAVSEPVVCEMVSGALRPVASSALHPVTSAALRPGVSGAKEPQRFAVAVSGVAGPGGGSKDKPVGTVCFAWGRTGGGIDSATRWLPGDREGVRRQSVAIALQGILDRLNNAKQRC